MARSLLLLLQALLSPVNKLPHRLLKRRWLALLGLCAALLIGGARAQEEAASSEPATDAVAATPRGFDALVAALPEAGYADKQDLIKQLVATGDPRTAALLHALLDGRLYAADGKVYLGEGEPPQFRDALDAQATPGALASEPQKVGTNNQLRKALKGLLAQLDLGNPDPAARRQAVQEMLRSIDASSVEALRAHLVKETDPGVLRSIDVGLALADLQSEDAELRLAAVGRLAGEVSAEVYNGLASLANANEDGSFTEPEPQVRAAAAAALAKIEVRRKIYGVLETLFFGLSLGSVLVLAAIGLAISFGVMGIINMAHGELIMLGAYTTYVMQLLMPQHIALSVLLSIPAAFLVSGLAGVAIERGIVRFLQGRPLETLLATFGLSLVLQQLVRSVFSPLNRSVATPEFMSGSLVFNDAFAITYNRLYIVLFMLMVFTALLLVLKHSSLGLKVRAVAQNRSMARALGVRTDWVDAATFGLGSGIAGVAGVALSQLTNVGPNLGQAYIIDSFMVVVFGGVGSLWGTLISGMSLGVINKLLEPWAGAVMAKILVLVFLIVFIQKRPRGLFPQKGRAAEH